MSNYGFRVAKDGYDALSSGDVNMAFTSKLYSDKLLAVPSVSTTFSGTVATATFYHGLGYVPQFWAFDYLPGSVFMPAYLGNYWGTGNDVTFDAIADANNIYFCWLTTGVGSMSPAITVTAIIYLFERSM